MSTFRFARMKVFLESRKKLRSILIAAIRINGCAFFNYAANLPRG